MLCLRGQAHSGPVAPLRLVGPNNTSCQAIADRAFRFVSILAAAAAPPLLLPPSEIPLVPAPPARRRYGSPPPSAPNHFLLACVFPSMGWELPPSTPAASISGKLPSLMHFDLCSLLQERKSFDEKFVRIDTEKLCKLASAALGLQLRPLVDLTCGALARIIGGKTPDEVRDIFHLPDDLTEEEKLEPLKNINDDPTIRLLNRLYAKKRKELQERQKLKDVQTQEELKDERSLDELLCFINGDEGSRGGKAAKSKKKNKRRKDQAKNPSKANSEPVNKEGAGCVVQRKADIGNISRLPCQSPGLQDDIEYPFEDADLDDGLDPAMREEIDR
nr:unnamed protein product [Digitaria exilis]